jgi:hypothetical protein
MKRFFPILIAFLALTACPQAGQVLSPGNNATAPKEGSETPPPAETPPDGTPPPEVTPPAANNPIEPKSDVNSIISGEHVTLAQLRYGKDFGTVLVTNSPDSVPVSKGEIHLPAVVEMRATPNDPWLESTDCYVRMIYRPKDTAAPLQYCDAAVPADASTEEGGNVLFSGVPSGLGTLEFYHLMPSCSETLAKLKIASGFTHHDGISSCSLGWQTLVGEDSLPLNWNFMGSLKGVGQLQNVSQPAPPTRLPLPPVSVTP